MIYIVGAGLFGCVIAERIANSLSKEVLIIDKRNHVGGNCYSFVDSQTGINCHKYGAHIFHTSNKVVYDYISRFITLNNYRHQVLTRHNNVLYQMPINLRTINDFFNLSLSPSKAENFLHEKINANKKDHPINLEEQAISLIGKELYEAFIKGYTAKQWQRDPKELPSYIIKRLPFRTNYNSDYFNDLYQGVPIGGYKKLFDGLLENPLIKINLNTSYQDIKYDVKDRDLLIYSGAVDELFEYQYGPLEWRSLDFKWEIKEVSDYQGISVINEADINVPYTRTHEFKHFHPENINTFNNPKSIICREFSKEFKLGDEPYYPIDTPKNHEKFNLYYNLAKEKNNIILGGRLGTYKYMDMDKTIQQALETWEKLISLKVI